MRHRTAWLFCLCVIGLASCAHPYRVPRGTLERLTRKGEPIVLVFGSLSISAGAIARPTIRFVHQKNRSSPEFLLGSFTVSSGGRFYAVLKAPPELPYLDEFYAEVGNANDAFDKILYVRLHQGDAPLAMYVGEIRLSRAADREARNHRVAVDIDDGFQNAAQELKRLYPHFDATITKAAVLRKPEPKAAPPERLR